MKIDDKYYAELANALYNELGRSLDRGQLETALRKAVAAVGDKMTTSDPNLWWIKSLFAKKKKRKTR